MSTLSRLIMLIYIYSLDIFRFQTPVTHFQAIKEKSLYSLALGMALCFNF